MEFLNSRRKNTKGNKIRKIKTLKRVISEKINENQEIKRLMRYYKNVSPLSKKSLDYSGNICVQADIREDLFKSSLEGEQVLFLNSFKPTMETCKQPYIFIYSPVSTFDRINGSITFLVSILCPEEFNSLALYDEERIYEIAERIEDCLDEYTIDEPEKIDEIGALKFEMLGSFVLERLSKTDNILLLTIPFRVKNINMRSDINV